MKRFEGKVALVCAAGSTIGTAIAQRLAREGATVMAADADAAAAEKVAVALGGAHKAAALDVSSVESWERVLAHTIDTFKRLDVLITVATEAYSKPTPIADTSLAQFRSVTTPNIEGAFLGLRYGVVKMRELGNGGAVVNVASAYATIGLANQAAYNASANGIRLMTKAAALSCADAKDNIRINAVQTGVVAGTPEMAAVSSLAGVPLGRRGSAEDIAAAVAYLASDDASYITGYVLPVDGGLLAA
jgi:NAD(P)-dependent dehydrogenase (short-subunit alcohol dehydrogenase family)